MSKKKKPLKMDFTSMEPLQHSPFAALGDAFGLSSNPTAATPKARAEKQAAPSLMVRREKRNKGKRVTCIYHLQDDGKPLLAALKAKLGSGGKADAQVVELQGDHCAAVVDFLERKGFKVRLG